jgi:hypothetical protein
MIYINNLWFLQHLQFFLDNQGKNCRFKFRKSTRGHCFKLYFWRNTCLNNMDLFCIYSGSICKISIYVQKVIDVFFSLKIVA